MIYSEIIIKDSKMQMREDIKALWNAGKTYSEIASKLKITHRYAKSQIDWMRRKGWQLASHRDMIRAEKIKIEQIKREKAKKTAECYKITIGLRRRYLRRFAGKTFDGVLARKLGVKPQTVMNYRKEFDIPKYSITWDNPNKNKLQGLWNSGKPMGYITKEFGCSEKAITSKISVLRAEGWDFKARYNRELKCKTI